MYTQTLENSLYDLNSSNILEEKEKDGWQRRLWRWHPVNNYWNYKEKDKIVVEIYSNCEKVELFLNSESLGVKYLTDFEDHIYKWCVEYQEGKLTAIGEKNGSKIIEDLITEKAFASIELTCDDVSNSKIGDDIQCIAQLVDGRNNFV